MRGPRPVVAAVFVLAVLVLVAVAAAAGRSAREVSFFTREPVSALTVGGATCNGPSCSYVGVVSNLGVLLWCAAAAACFLAAALTSGRRSPLLYAGLLTTALLADDLFLLHEGVYALVIEERIVFGLYALALVGFVVAFRRFLRETTPSLFAAACALFAVSLVVDERWAGNHLLEDGSKFLGIVATHARPGAGSAFRTAREGAAAGRCPARVQLLGGPARRVDAGLVGALEEGEQHRARIGGCADVVVRKDRLGARARTHPGRSLGERPLGEAGRLGGRIGVEGRPAHLRVPRPETEADRLVRIRLSRDLVRVR